MRFVFLSDTHGQHRHLKVPDGDVLAHCGDATVLRAPASGRDGLAPRARSRDILEDFCRWFMAQPHRHKVFVPGNHEAYFRDAPEFGERWLGEAYTNAITRDLDGIRVFGMAGVPQFSTYWAFGYERDSDLARQRWKLIPDRVDVLITHGPPYEILDHVAGVPPRHVGCRWLAQRVMDVQPRIHAFGHVHESAGTLADAGLGCTTRFVNAALCGDRYRLVPGRAPIVVDIDGTGPARIVRS